MREFSNLTIFNCFIVALLICSGCAVAAKATSSKDQSNRDQSRQSQLMTKSSNNVDGPANYTILSNQYPLEAQVISPNHIYVIEEHHDLNGKEVKLPDGIVLKFTTGSLRNGHLTGDNVAVDASPITIFDNILFVGSICGETCPEWWGAVGDGENDDTDAIKTALRLSKFVRLQPNKSYLLSSSIYLGYNESIVGSNSTNLITKGGRFPIFILGHSSSVTDINVCLDEAQCVFEVCSEWIKESYMKFNKSKDAWKYVSAAGIHVSNVNVWSLSETKPKINVNCIECISNGEGTGFWNVNFRDIYIHGLYQYAIYLNNGTAATSSVPTWQTDFLFKNIKIGKSINGIYIGKDDTIDRGGFPPERITFENVSMQYYKGVSNRFAYVNAGNRIAFHLCEPWDWPYSSLPPFLVNPNCTRGVSINDCMSIDTAMPYELSEQPKVNSSIPKVTSMLNSPSQATYDFNNVISSERLALQTPITVGEIRKLPSGLYNVPASSAYSIFLNISSFDTNVIGLGPTFLSIQKGRNNSALLTLFATPKDSELNSLYSISYIVISATADSNEAIPNWIQSQPRITLHANDDEFLKSAYYKYYSLGFVGNRHTSQLCFKTYDNQILNVFGQTKTRLFGETNQRPVSLVSSRDSGKMFFDVSLGKPIWWVDSRWVESSGNPANANTSGTFQDRPKGVKVGYAYFCVDRKTKEGDTMGIMIYYKGNDVWVDALGRVVR